MSEELEFQEEPSSQRLVDDIRSVVKKNPSISHFSNCIYEGSFNSNKKYYINFGSNIDCINTCWVTLYTLNKVRFKKILNYLYEKHYYADNREILNIFNPNYFNYKIKTPFYLGVNIFKDISITGYHLNICDIFTMNTENERYLKYVYKLLFISEKNYLVGIIDCDGVLWLDSILLNKIRVKSLDEFEELVKRIFKTFSNANAAFMECNTEYAEKTIFDIVGRKLVSTISDDLNESKIITEDNIDIFSDNNQLETYISKISSTIKDITKKCLKQNFLGINDNYSYQELLKHILNSYINNDKLKIQDAFMQGLTIGNKMECIGWTLNTKFNKFNNFDQNSIVWEKDVNIVPNIMFYKHKEYVIDPSDENWTNPFKITKLYVTSTGVMYCEGKHPNVSSGKVCMGDISGKISFTDIENLQKNLNRCESLLYAINYDSAYSSSNIEEMLRHSRISELQKFSDSEYVAQGATIQDISFEDDEESQPQSIQMDNNYE